MHEVVHNNAEVPTAFRNNYVARIEYSSSTEGTPSIITLADNVDSWSVGDQIMIASTSFEVTVLKFLIIILKYFIYKTYFGTLFEVRESEVFTIVECSECSSNQVQLNRPAEFENYSSLLLFFRKF